MTKISKYFTLEEFTASQTATRMGINNRPSAAVIVCITNLCTQLLDPLREQVGAIRISSGYRSPELNAKIGGAANSQHTLGQAADITVAGMSNYDLACLIRDNFNYDQVILEFGDWVHVSYRMPPTANKRQPLTAIKQSGKTVYIGGIVA